MPSWLLYATAWLVTGTGLLVLVALCLWASIVAVETICRHAGLWRDVTEALWSIYMRRKGRKP
jgi:hypothetical protein